MGNVSLSHAGGSWLAWPASLCCGGLLLPFVSLSFQFKWPVVEGREAGVRMSVRQQWRWRYDRMRKMSDDGDALLSCLLGVCSLERSVGSYPA